MPSTHDTSGSDRQLERNIAELDLSVSSYKALKKRGVSTIKDLLGYTKRSCWAKSGYPLGICRSKEIALMLGRRGLADTKELLASSGYPASCYSRRPLHTSRMALYMPARGPQKNGTI